jgi:hypothetical protein
MKPPIDILPKIKLKRLPLGSAADTATSDS